MHVIAEVAKRRKNGTFTVLGMVALHVAFYAVDADGEPTAVHGVDSVTVAPGAALACRMAVVADSWSRGVMRLLGSRRDRIQQACTRMWAVGVSAGHVPTCSAPTPWVKVRSRRLGVNGGCFETAHSAMGTARRWSSARTASGSWRPLPTTRWTCLLLRR
jgi:hypothetical protein